jgi:glucose/arabinose dehydrogenase
VLFVALVVALGGGVLVPASHAGAVGNLSTVHVNVTRVISGLKLPTAVAWRPNDATMYVAEQNGRIRRVVNGRFNGQAAKIGVSTGGERGLLGMAFSPGGTKMYIDYTDANGNTRVEELTMKNRNAPKKLRRLIYAYTQPFPNHNGGHVAIGPDGMLYIAFGDGGSGGDPFGNAQNKNTALGKILRISTTPSNGYPYSIPIDNPFVGQPGTRWDIWMYGLRNPWRFSFDKANGDMWIGDVGQGLYEEIDYAPAGQKGQNWGWNAREGFHPYNGGAQPPGGRDPVIERPHSAGDCAITGGYVYRGTAIPALVGAYLYGDYCTGKIYAAEQQGGAIVQNVELNINVPQLASFGQDLNGELYAVSQTGSIYKITP